MSFSHCDLELDLEACFGSFATTASNIDSDSDSVSKCSITRSKRPSLGRRKTSTEQNRLMRDLMTPWNPEFSDSPPQCRSIMFSSWKRFDPSPTSSRSTSSDNLKASVLWSASATMPEFNPPIYERAYLGVDHGAPKTEGGKMFQQRKWPHQYKRTKSALRSSWSTTSSAMSEPTSSGNGISFKKQPVRSISTSSLLTSEVTASQSGINAQQRGSSTSLFAQMMKKERMNASMLPSAFDSDSEDEDEED
jgi:hypothetical protein